MNEARPALCMTMEIGTSYLSTGGTNLIYLLGHRLGLSLSYLDL